MPNASKNKGSAFERATVNAHKERGITAMRIDARLGQFGADKSHDIDVYIPGRDAPLIGEAKRRAKLPALFQALADNDFLVVRADRGKPLYVVPERIWFELLGVK